MANPQTGRRFVARPGNAQKRKALELRNLSDGTYYWSVQALNNAFVASPFAEEGSFTINGAPGETQEDPVSLVPTRFALYGNYPNPFNTSTTIRYDLPEPSTVVLKVYNVLGAEVITLVEGTVEAGTHQVQWDGRSAQGRSLGTGPYFYELRAGNTRHTGKMMFVR
jgi:hypothetical protein